jgi:hypothetical protein
MVILHFASTPVGIVLDPIGVHGLHGLASIGEIANTFKVSIDLKKFSRRQ